jgi:hypothetical protein
MYVADRRLYLDKDGKVVEADDPTRQSLLISSGGTMPEADARRLGLMDVDEPKAAKAPANKAKAAPSNKAS